MIQDNTIEIVFGIGMAILSFLYSRFTKRQEVNKNNIASLQTQVTETDHKVENVKADVRDEVLVEILEAKRSMEESAKRLGGEVTDLRNKVNSLEEKLKVAEGENSKLRAAIYDQQEAFKQQLGAKETELSQAKADLKIVTTQLDGALKDFVDQNKQHASDILELKTELALQQAQIKGYQAVFELAMKNRLMPVPTIAADAPPLEINATVTMAAPPDEQLTKAG